ncbi:MAG: ABC transporter permease [Actinobacteria bacterium]|nr:ABC transporter permease [Actinomycetota bacterium]
MATAVGTAAPGRRRGSTLLLLVRVFTRRPSRLIGLVIVLGFAAMAIFGPYMYGGLLPVDPLNIYAKPSLEHPLGTDFAGTDVLALIVRGARYVLAAAALAAVIHVVVGTAFGLVSGYYLGVTDSVLMRITDFALTVPSFPLLIVLSTIWDFGSAAAMGFVLGIVGWGALARAVRSQALSLRERGFIEAARGLGLSPTHIVFRELLPNVAPYIAMNLLLSVTAAIYAEVGLFFLGVVPFGTDNWGVMLNLAVFQAGAITSTEALTYLLSPLVAILLITLGVVLILDAIDELFNPRLREAYR